MRRSLFTLPLLGLWLVSCASVKVRSDYDPKADFSEYRTYRWAERLRTDDPSSLVDNDLINQRVHRAVDEVLAAKGYRLVAEGPVDFLVGWHGSVERKYDIETIGADYVYGPGWYMSGWGGSGLYPAVTYLHEWNQGTLIVDIADAQKNELVWRGSASQALGDDPPTGEKAQEKMNGTVEKVLKDFPP